MNANLDNQEYLKDGKFFLWLQNLELLVKGDDFNSAYNELIQKKCSLKNNERIKSYHSP